MLMPVLHSTGCVWHMHVLLYTTSTTSECLVEVCVRVRYIHDYTGVPFEPDGSCLELACLLGSSSGGRLEGGHKRKPDDQCKAQSM